MEAETPAEQITDVAPAQTEPPAPPPAPAAPSVPAAAAAPEPAAPVVPAPPVAAPPAGPVAPAPAPAAVPAGPSSPSPDTVAESRVMDAAWPFRGYSGPQAWEAENPPTLTQNHLMLSPGGSGAEVVELAALLGQLGYSSSITTGQNPHAIYDESLVRAVQAFGRDYGVTEDPEIIRARTPDTVGPWMWEAITRAVYKVAQASSQAGESA